MHHNQNNEDVALALMYASTKYKFSNYGKKNTHLTPKKKKRKKKK